MDTNSCIVTSTGGCECKMGATDFEITYVDIDMTLILVLKYTDCRTFGICLSPSVFVYCTDMTSNLAHIKYRLTGLHSKNQKPGWLSHYSDYATGWTI